MNLCTLKIRNKNGISFQKQYFLFFKKNTYIKKISSKIIYLRHVKI
jgi:hypothetical protein